MNLPAEFSKFDRPAQVRLVRDLVAEFVERLTAAGVPDVVCVDGLGDCFVKTLLGGLGPERTAAELRRVAEQIFPHPPNEKPRPHNARIPCIRCKSAAVSLVRTVPRPSDYLHLLRCRSCGLRFHSIEIAVFEPGKYRYITRETTSRFAPSCGG